MSRTGRAQTTYTIDYSFLTLSGCNIFAKNPAIDTYYPHQTCAGAPYYSPSSQKSAVALKCGYTSADSTRTTQYRIQLAFKKGYAYSVQAYAEGFASAGGLSPLLGLKIANNAEGTDTTKVCGKTKNISSSNELTYTVAGEGPSYAWATILQNVVADSNYDYLQVAAFVSYPASRDTADSVFIRTLVISETPPFSLSPASLNVSCGQQLTQVFIVNNNTGRTGITGYSWNLGSASNGWLYNGTPAPAVVNTTTNTLSLTSSGTLPPGNISVTVTYGDGTLVTNTAAISFSTSLPSMSISGAGNVCTPQTYTITGLPATSTVSWSISPALATISPATGSQTTVTKGRISGNATLTAIVSNSCGGKADTLNKAIIIGSIPSILSGPYDPATNGLTSRVVQNSPVYFIAYESTPGAPAETYTWTQTPPPGTDEFITHYAGSKVTISFLNVGNYGLAVSKTNSCGTTSTQTNVRVQDPQSVGAVIQVKTAPNPGAGTFMVTVENVYGEGGASGVLSGVKGNGTRAIASIDKITIYDMGGRVKKVIAGNKARQMEINAGDLAAGIYIIEVTSGGNSGRQKMVVQH